MAYRNYSTAVSHVVDTNGQGDFTTIAAALTAASSGQTIFIRPGTYTENITLKAGVNLVSFTSESQNGQVIINGKCTFTQTGNVNLAGIQLQTNSDFCLSVTGTNASTVGLFNCYINCLNNTGIQFTSSNSSSVISLLYTNGNVATTGIGLYTQTSPGVFQLIYSTCNNTGNSTTLSSNSAGKADYFYSTINIPISCTSTGIIGLTEVFIDTSAINATCVATAGTGTSTIQHASFASGSAVTFTVGAGTVINTNAIIVGTSNTNLVTGTGTFSYTIIEQGGTPANINASTNTAVVTNIGLGRASSISFDNGANLLNSYTTNTFTPVLNFAGGTTGITYTTQVGKYWKVGSIVYIEIDILLSNKGSSTGNAGISGLPFTSRAGETGVMVCLTGNVTFTGISPAIFQVNSAATSGLIFQGVQAGDVAVLQDTAFGNTSRIRTTGFYFTA